MLVVNLKAVSPAEFWQLTPNEAGMITEWHMEQAVKHKPKTGALTDEQYEHIETRRARLRAKGLDVI